MAVLLLVLVVFSSACGFDNTGMKNFVPKGSFGVAKVVFVVKASLLPLRNCTSARFAGAKLASKE